MTLRVFVCKDCGHKMRLGGNHCGKCYARKAPYQMPRLWYSLAAIVAILLIVGGISAISSAV